MRVFAVVVATMALGCTCADRVEKEAPAESVPGAKSPIGVRLGLPVAPWARSDLGLAASLEVPPGAALTPAVEGVARLQLEGIAVRLRQVAADDPLATEAWWLDPRRMRQSVRDSDDDGWLLIGDAPGGRTVVVYRARAAVLCEGGPTADKRALLNAARSCLSIAPR